MARDSRESARDRGGSSYTPAIARSRRSGIDYSRMRRPRDPRLLIACSRCVPTDAGDTDLLGEPGRSGRELAGRSALETRGGRRLFHAGQGAGGTAEETARFPSLPGVRNALGERRVTWSDHRADDQFFIRTVSATARWKGV